jgi:ABC-type transporter Mla subunit MlaD
MNTDNPSLEIIDARAKRFADAREQLGNLVQTVNSALEAVKRAHMAQIKTLVQRAAQRHAELQAAIEVAPHLFEKPRTLVLHGIKVGFRKGTGGIDWEDDEHVAEV